MIDGYFGAASFQSLAARGGSPRAARRCCYKPAAMKRPGGPAWFAASMQLPDPRPLGRRSFAYENHEVVDGFGGSTIGLGAFGAFGAADCTAAGISAKVLGNLFDIKSALVNAILDCGEQSVKDAVASMSTLAEYAAPVLDAAIAAAREKVNKAAGTTPPTTPSRQPRNAWREFVPADPCAPIPEDVWVRAGMTGLTYVGARNVIRANRRTACAVKKAQEASGGGGGGGGGGAATGTGTKLPWAWIGLGAAALGIGGLVLIRKRRARAA